MTNFLAVNSVIYEDNIVTNKVVYINPDNINELYTDWRGDTVIVMNGFNIVTDTPMYQVVQNIQYFCNMKG